MKRNLLTMLRSISNARRLMTRLALVALLLALGALAPAPTAQAGPTLPVATLLNPDGTLNPAAGINGALDLRGWQVTLDAERGPLFQPADSPPANPGTGWNALGTGMGALVNAIAVSGSNVYAGGNFTTAGTCTSVDGCNYIAKWDGTMWSALGTGMDGVVSAIAVSGSNVYAGGYFTTAGGGAASRIAIWNGSGWSQLGTGMNVGSSVRAIAVSGSDVYAGGSFTSAGGVANTTYIAKWNGSAWSALGTGMDSQVRAIAISGTGDVYAGGAFTSAGTCTSGNGCNYIAKWNSTTWSALGTGMDLPVYAIAVSGSDVYAGGGFTTTGDGVTTLNRIAKWDGVSTWSALGAGMNATVVAIAVSGSNVYAGGDFTTAGGGAASRIAKWDGVSTWSAMGAGMNVGSNVYAIASGTDVYAGGSFTSAGTCTSGNGCNYIARYGLAPTAVTLSSFSAQSDDSLAPPTITWIAIPLGLAGLLIAGTALFLRRRR